MLYTAISRSLLRIAYFLIKKFFMSEEKKLTTAASIPFYHNEDTPSAGPRGPLLLQDFTLHEKMAHFNRERIPERVVHAKGSAAYGAFTVTNGIILRKTAIKKSRLVGGISYYN